MLEKRKPKVMSGMYRKGSLKGISLSSVLLLVVLLAGCGTTTTSSPLSNIQIPESPRETGELPNVTAGDLQCVTDETYRRLVLREVMYENRVQELRGILEELVEE